MERGGASTARAGLDTDSDIVTGHCDIVTGHCDTDIVTEKSDTL